MTSTNLSYIAVIFIALMAGANPSFIAGVVVALMIDIDRLRTRVDKIENLARQTAVYICTAAGPRAPQTLIFALGQLTAVGDTTPRADLAPPTAAATPAVMPAAMPAATPATPATSVPPQKWEALLSAACSEDPWVEHAQDRAVLGGPELPHCGPRLSARPKDRPTD